MPSSAHTPSYDQILAVANDMSSMENLVLRHQRFTSTSQRMWYYNQKDEAQKLLEAICAEGRHAESGKTEQDLDNPFDPSFAYKTLRHFTRTAILSIRNGHARREYLEKISNWAKGYSNYLRAGGETAKLAAERAVAMRNFSHAAMETKLSASSRATSEGLGKIWKGRGNSFAAVLEYAKEQNHLKDVPFSELKEDQLTSVYAKVVELSGLENKVLNYISLAAEAAGYAVIVLTLASLVFDISVALSQGKDEILTKVLEDAAELGGTLLGAYAAEAVAASLFGSAEALSLLGIALFGFAGAIVGGAVVGGAVVASMVAYFVSIFRDKNDNEWTAYLKQPILYRVKLPKCYAYIDL